MANEGKDEWTALLKQVEANQKQATALLNAQGLAPAQTAEIDSEGSSVREELQKIIQNNELIAEMIHKFKQKMSAPFNEKRLISNKS